MKTFKQYIEETIDKSDFRKKTWKIKRWKIDS